MTRSWTVPAAASTSAGFGAPSLLLAPTTTPAAPSCPSLPPVPPPAGGLAFGIYSRFLSPPEGHPCHRALADGNVPFSRVFIGRREHGKRGRGILRGPGPPPTRGEDPAEACEETMMSERRGSTFLRLGFMGRTLTQSDKVSSWVTSRAEGFSALISITHRVHELLLFFISFIGANITASLRGREREE